MTFTLDGQGSITKYWREMLGRSHLLYASSIFPGRDTVAGVPVLSPLCLFTHCLPQRDATNRQTGAKKLGLRCITHSPSISLLVGSQPPTGSMLLRCSSKAQLSNPIGEAFPDPEMTSIILLTYFSVLCIFIILSCCIILYKLTGQPPHSTAP